MSRSDVESADELFRKRAKILSEIDNEISRRFESFVTVLFTDIVVSTKYFETHGDLAGRQLIQIHNDLLFPIISDYEGEVVKTIGDAIMARFNDTNNAVNCAVACQLRLAERNYGNDESEGIHVRMGLHCGNAVTDEHDVFGDVVNTASRVESFADGGEVLISEDVHRSLSLEVETVPVGERSARGKRDLINLFVVNWEELEKQQILEKWKTIDRGSRHHAGDAVELLPVDIKAEISRAKQSSSNGNPYLNRVMLHHPRMFYGRRQFLARLYRRISADSPQSVSMVGERRIGKSSLLNMLRYPTLRAVHLDAPETVYFVFVDFQALKSENETGCFHAIICEMKKQIGTYLHYEGPDDFRGILAICEAASKQGFHIVFLFDEFESATNNLQLKPAFFAKLRSLANNYPASFVIATGSMLHNICIDAEVADSPFFNIFTARHLGLLEDEDARNLIRKPSAECGYSLEGYEPQIISMGGTHPFFLQIACCCWFDYLSGPDYQAGKPEKNRTPKEVHDLFLEESQGHFSYILSSLSSEEIKALKRLSGKRRKKVPEGIATTLVRKGYVAQSKSGIELFSEEFARFVATWMPTSK